MWRKTWSLGSASLLLGLSLLVTPAGGKQPVPTQREEQQGPNVIWMIGVFGHAHNDGGFCVHGTIAILDRNTNRVRAPARNFLVQTQGREVAWHLDPYDRILSIDGNPVNNLRDLVLAVNGSENLPTLTITFRDNATGRIYTGTIKAARVRDNER